MGAFFKKDLLVFWRDRKEIIIPLITPIILIIILNVAFSGLFGGDEKALDLDVAVVWEDDESLGLEQFAEAMREKNIPETERENLLEQAGLISPNGLLREFLTKDFLHLHEVSETEAVEQVKNGDLDALIKVPKGFTFDVLGQILLDQHSETSLILQSEGKSTESELLSTIINNYLESLNLQFALSDVTGGQTGEPVLPQGGREVVEGVETFTMSQYFTIAMSTLFTLMMASTVAMKTTMEKRELVFNRILLTNSHPLTFLMGKVASTFLLAWIQLIVVFSISHFALDVFPGNSLGFWLGMLLIISVFALTVAGLSAVFTSVTLRLENSEAANGFFILITMVMAAVGGNFFPMDMFPAWAQKIGEWTPNGQSFSVFKQWIQYGNPESLIQPLILMVVFFLACLVIGILLFPRRGRI